MAEEEKPTPADGEVPEAVEATGEQPEARTELIPAVETGEGIASTRQLPAVAPVPPAPSPQAQPPQAQPVPPHQPPQRQPPQSSSREAPAAADGPRTVSVRNVALALVAVVLVAILGIAIGKILPSGSDDSAGGTKSSSGSSSKGLSPDISSYDPVGGSGFRRSGNAWVTETYTSATFGNLKEGVGLVLDLGEKSGVDKVSFTVDGATVQLRAADSEGQFGDGFVPVGSATTASGATTLSGDGGGDHRYWIIWVSQLGDNDGFSARISDIRVTAS